MSTQKLNLLFTTTILTMLIGSPVWADDTEIFFGGGSSSANGNPNIMLILDTSGSMQELVPSRTAYDPDTTYSGNCSNSNVYFSKQTTDSNGNSTTVIPLCSAGGAVSNSSLTLSYISKTSFRCSTATNSGGAFETSGYLLDAGIRWITKGTQVGSGSTTYTYAWDDDMNPSNSSSTTRGTTTNYTFTKGDIACQSNNYNGNYPNNNSPTSTTQWTGNSNSSYWPPSTSAGVATQFIFYSANYLNYYASTTTTYSSRLSIVQTAAKNLIDSLSNVNVGLMRYDTQGTGGMVMAQAQDVATGRSNLKNEIDTWTAAGNTPLTETLSEAFRYFTGDTVNFGNNSYKCTVTDTAFTGCPSSKLQLAKSVAASRSNGSLSDTRYNSPMDYSCQKNYVVYLTDGLPTSDTGADTYIKALDSTNSKSSACYSSDSAIWTSLGVTDPGSTSGGTCLKKLTSYMYRNDLSTSLSDTQNVTSYFVGFGSDVSTGSAFTYLKDAAVAGGGNAYAATDLTTLTNTLNTIVLGIRDDSATFTSPSVAVNAFNKTQVLEDMYISVFQPSLKAHWPGNVKKYKLRNGMIVGQDTTTSAVDTTTGFFKPTSQSFWSDSADGKTTAKGGAANEIPVSSARNVYTYIGSDPAAGSSFPDLSSNINYSVEDGNSNITNSALNIGGTGDPSRTTILNWIRGQDVKDDNNNSNTTEARHVMGDPVHSQPAVVIYGKIGTTTTDKLNDAVVYISTNDGYLHALDVTNGTELWSYIPQDLLSDQKLLYTNANSSTKHYSLDGNIRVLKYDVNGDGEVDVADGDRVFLYFSQGRGGDNYYALDVTDKAHPKYMWTLPSSTLGNLVQQSWSTPALGRVKISGATQNPQKLVLIFTAGFDSQHETNQNYRSAGDTYGNGIFMVDAVRGNVLWSKTRTVSGAFSKMTHAIPSEVAVMDTNSDGWSDRMYVGDLAGQLWRFDIYNGATNSTSDPLVTGGVIASLGAKAESSPSIANNRRFYNKPDISKFVVSGGANYYNIAIGSGDRAHPKLNTTTLDHFYSIHDYHLEPLSQSAYDSYIPLNLSNLTQIDGTTSVTIGGNGWWLPMGAGEKILAESITVNGTVMFTTYVPTASSSTCNVSTGGGRAYALSIEAGKKYFTNLYESFATTGLPSQITIVNQAGITRTDGTSSSSSTTTSSSSNSSSATASGTCLSGVSILGSCMQFGSMVKTFWQDAGAN